MTAVYSAVTVNIHIHTHTHTYTHMHTHTHTTHTHARMHARTPIYNLEIKIVRYNDIVVATKILYIHSKFNVECSTVTVFVAVLVCTVVSNPLSQVTHSYHNNMSGYSDPLTLITASIYMV